MVLVYFVLFVFFYLECIFLFSIMACNSNNVSDRDTPSHAHGSSCGDKTDGCVEYPN